MMHSVRNMSLALLAMSAGNWSFLHPTERNTAAEREYLQTSEDVRSKWLSCLLNGEPKGHASFVRLRRAIRSLASVPVCNSFDLGGTAF
jgi:hypothetical protein